MLGKKSILLVDRDDLRRNTRITLLEAQGAEVTARDNCSTSASLDCEGTFDLLIVVVDSDNLKEATRYAEHVHLSNSNLPILLLRDLGVSLPAVTSGRLLEAGDPRKLVLEVAEMLESVPETGAFTGDWKRRRRPARNERLNNERPNQAADD